MFCLRCSTKMTRNALKNTILVDYCPKCRSFWLDKGELEKLRKGKPEDTETLKKEARKEKKYEPVLTIKGACPRCFGKLARYNEGSVRLDKCTRCEGIFFDKGELDACLKADRTSFLNRVLNALDFGGKDGD